MNEYQTVDIDLAQPGTIPWVAKCLACELRQQFINDDRDSGQWLPDLAEHFWHDHQIELIQHRASTRLGKLIKLAGPYVRTEIAVRYKIVAEDSPYLGQTRYDVFTDRVQGDAREKMFRRHPEKFADVALVQRTVTMTEWAQVLS